MAALLLLLKLSHRELVPLTVLLQQLPLAPTPPNELLLLLRMPAAGNLSGEAKAPALLFWLQLKRSALISVSVGIL
jgi:hypothetical protein